MLVCNVNIFACCEVFEFSLEIISQNNSTKIIMNKDIHLISLVERFPHLYDKKDAKYKDRTAVENSWLFISGELEIPTAECIARWSALRSRFSKERAKKYPQDQLYKQNGH